MHSTPVGALSAALACVTLVAPARPASATPLVLSIPRIQSAAHASPFLADSVSTTGIVTMVGPDGFYLQDPLGDGDDATSDAVFVFTSSPPPVSAADEVRVVGLVEEYLPDGDTANLTITEIRRPVIERLGTGRPLPPPVRVARDGRLPPPAVIDDDGLTRYEPARDGIDFYESLEGMRVRVVAPRMVQGTNAFGEVWVVPETALLSARGALAIGPGDARPERIQIDDPLLAAPMPPLRVGDALLDVTGAVSYRFGNYELLADATPVRQAGQLSREIDALPRDPGRVRVASFNLHNLGPDDSARMDEIARLVVSHLGSPEIIGLEEIEDDSGPEDDGTVAATAMLRALADAVRSADGPAYDFREVEPADGADGGAPGSNIRVAFLFDPARVEFVDRGDSFGSAETRVTELDSRPRLTRSPGRILPANPAWVQSRKPLAGEFRVAGTTVFVIVAHFVSQSRSSPDFGAVQPPADPDATRRVRQAELVAGFVADVLAIDPRARIVVLGDLNDDWFSPTVAALERTPLADLWRELPPQERYSLLFDGAGQAFDHVLVSDALQDGAVFDAVHVAAEFPDGVSDHDPVVASLRVAAPEPARTPLALSDPRPNPFGSRVELEYESAHPGLLQVGVFDVTGRRVRWLGRGPKTPGRGTVVWNADDDAHRRVPAGVYLIRVSDGVETAIRKVVRIP